MYKRKISYYHGNRWWTVFLLISHAGLKRDGMMSRSAPVVMRWNQGYKGGVFEKFISRSSELSVRIVPAGTRMIRLCTRQGPVNLRTAMEEFF